MLEYAMPPEIPAIPAARIGHNSKAQLADKIAAVRQAFLDANLSETATFRHKLLSIAYASGMNPADFHVLWGLLTHGSADGGNIAVSQKKLAMISGRGERTVRRIIETLEEDGWLTAPKKQRRLPSVRSASIPQSAMQSIVAEIVERSRATGQPVEVPNLKPERPSVASQAIQDRPSVASQEVKRGQIQHLREAKSDTQENLKIEPKNNPKRVRARRADPPGWLMAATLNPEEGRAQKRIWRVEGGSIEISDEFRAELECDFPLIPIDDTLRILKTESAMKDTALRLIEALERKFAYAQRDERIKTQRYADRAAQKPPQKYPEKPSEEEKKRRELRALGVKI